MKKVCESAYFSVILACNKLLSYSPLSDLEIFFFLEEPCYSQRKDLLDLSFIISMLLLHQNITESI